MMLLTFDLPEIGSPWCRTWDMARLVDPAGIAETDLRYKYFSSNVEMIVGGVVFVSKQNFVTLVDLALSFRSVVERISSGEDAAFGFTENDDVIRFRQNGESVLVSSSSGLGEVSISRENLLFGLSNFIQSAYIRLIEECPGLDRNPVILRIEP